MSGWLVGVGRGILAFGNQSVIDSDNQFMFDSGGKAEETPQTEVFSMQVQYIYIYRYVFIFAFIIMFVFICLYLYSYLYTR